MVHNLYKPSVSLDKVEHKYFNESGEELMSFTRLFQYLSPKFDAQNISKFVAKKEGVSQQNILDKWQKTADDGTGLDVAIKMYAQTGKISAENQHIESLIKKVSEKYAEYYSIYSDLIVYDNNFRVAGEIDRLCLTSNRRDSSFVISDFKRMENISYDFKGQKWLNYPFTHHLNSKYNKISWQLSFYAHLFSLLTGRPCERLFVDHIKPIYTAGKLTGYSNHLIPVANLKTDVIAFLNHFENRIKKDLEPKPIIEVSSEEYF